MNFSEQYNNVGEARDVRCDEKFISSRTCRLSYVYQGFSNVTKVTWLSPHIRKQRYYVNITLVA